MFNTGVRAHTDMATLHVVRTPKPRVKPHAIDERTRSLREMWSGTKFSESKVIMIADAGPFDRAVVEEPRPYMSSSRRLLSIDTTADVRYAASFDAMVRPMVASSLQSTMDPAERLGVGNFLAHSIWHQLVAVGEQDSNERRMLEEKPMRARRMGSVTSTICICGGVPMLPLDVQTTR